MGGLYCLFLILEKYLIKPDNRSWIIRALWQVVTLLLVNFNWVIFNAPDMSAGIRYCLSMAGIYGLQLHIEPILIYYLREYGFFLILGIVCSTPILEKLSGLLEKHSAGAIAVSLCRCAVFLWAVSFLILGAHNPFIYFNF